MGMEGLAAAVKGPVLRPGEDGFDEARSAWNARFARRPELVVRCQDAEDVRACVDHAREAGVLLSVKGGGHSYGGKTVGDGGILVDLSGMKHLDVDPDRRTAVVGPGVTCGELDLACQVHGLGTPVPTVSSVGVVGAALGGGSGYLSRKHGLTLDNARAFDVVTADGRLLEARPDENDDLYWAMRGAGANFGVATAMTLQLHEVGPEVLAGQVIYPFDEAGKSLRAFRDLMADAPEDFQCYPFMFRIPPVAPFPERYHGAPTLDFVLCHLDPEAVDVVQPLRELGEPILDVVGPIPYTEVQKSFDANLPKGQRYYSKAHYLDEISDDVIDVVTTHVPEMEGAFTAAYFEPLGGEIARVAPSATAFAGREASFGFHILAGWTEDEHDGSVMGWARELHDAMSSHATGGVYVNLLAEDEDERVRAAYGGDYRRLVQLKRKWDPDNLFRMNHNIPPSG